MHCRFDITKLTPFKRHFVLGMGVLRSYISRFIRPSKLIRDKYPNHPKSYKFENLVSIGEAEKRIYRYSGVSNVYTFLHAYFEGVEFYDAKQYVNLKNEG